MAVPKGYFAVLFKEKKSKTIGVRFPEHPGVISYGADWEEAQQMAQEALSAALESDFERGFELPSCRRPRAKKGEKIVFVRLEAYIRMAYLLRSWRQQAGLTQKQMAKRLGISYQAYQRMERPGRSNPTVETLERIATSLEGELVIDMEFPTKKLA